MNFPRHWAKAAADKFECWRWSDVSADDARAQAETAVLAFVEGLGNAEVHPEIQPLVEVHDQMTRIDQPKELA